MAPETFTLNMAVQVRLTVLPTVTLVLERERDADVIKPLGTEGKEAQTLTSKYLGALLKEGLDGSKWLPLHIVMEDAMSQV